MLDKELLEIMALGLIFVLGFLSGQVMSLFWRNLPLFQRRIFWSIGIYSGKTPFDITDAEGVSNPVLTGRDVTDTPVWFVADPFMVREGETWYMFFEAMNKRTRKGDIGLATSPDGLKWTYRQIVLSEKFHMAYPYVFTWQGSHYMIPDSSSNSVRLYKAAKFPTEWTFVKELLTGRGFRDSSIFRHGEKWWLITTTSPESNSTLRLYYADELEGPWTEHPKSPVRTEDPHGCRPAGRVLTLEGRIYRFAQDCYPTYGSKVTAFQIVELTETTYMEIRLRNEAIIEASGQGWNAEGMHAIDAIQVGQDKWVVCVDGLKSRMVSRKFLWVALAAIIITAGGIAAIWTWGS